MNSYVIVVPILVLMSFSILVFADEDNIPSWIKNTAGWWSNDKVSDKEFIDSMRYLIQKNILVVRSQEIEGFVTIDDELFEILYPKESLRNPMSIGGFTKLEVQPYFKMKDNMKSTYDEIGNFDKSQNTVFVYPTFTESAYMSNGFYSYYDGTCDKRCLTIPVMHEQRATFSSSGNAAVILSLLRYDHITDIDLIKNPQILNQFDKVIILHNEYVTKEMFDIITNHPKVIYLYPNALYAEVKYNQEQNTISLVRGHDYPKGVDNGFDWKFDNTRPDEFDTKCKNWKFRSVDNGIMLDCYPENIIFKNFKLLKTIKDY